MNGNGNDLPGRRKRYGFDNLDFNFWTHGRGGVETCLDSVDTASADREGNFDILMGADEENLVFHTKSEIVWLRIN